VTVATSNGTAGGILSYYSFAGAAAEGGPQAATVCGSQR